MLNCLTYERPKITRTTLNLVVDLDTRRRLELISRANGLSMTRVIEALICQYHTDNYAALGDF